MRRVQPEKENTATGRGLRVALGLCALCVFGVGGWWVIGLFGDASKAPIEDGRVEPVTQDETRVVRGFVLDRETGARIANAKVTLRGEDGGMVSVKASRRGVFVFRAEALDMVQVDARGVVRASAPSYGESAEWVPAEVGSDVKVYLAQRGEVEGKVTAQGEGIEGARVSVLRMANGVEEEGDEPGEADVRMDDVEVVTGKGGVFSMRLKPGRVRLLVEAEGHGLGESREVVVRGGAAVNDVVVDLTERGQLRVVAIDPQGRPVSGARVEFIGLATWEVPTATTGEDGAADVEGVPQGKVRLRVRAAGFALSAIASVDVNAEDVMEVRVQLQPVEGISGRVLSPRGQGVKYATVVLFGEDGAERTRSNTDEGGIFRFEGVDEGVYSLQATHPRYGPSERVQIQGESRTNVELTLGEGGTIQGTVYDADGNPVSDATLVVERFTPLGDVPQSAKGPSARNFPRRRLRDPEGKFTFANLAEGVYDLYADAGNLGQGGVRNITVRAGEVTSNVRIDLQSGVSLKGRVINAETGAPVPGASISLRDLARSQRRLGPRSARTNAEGEFSFQGVAPGRRSVTISKQGYTTKIRAGLEISARSTDVQLDIELVPLAPGQRPQMEFFGIGAVLEPSQDGNITVRSTLDNAPGSIAGLQAGDEIMTVDNQNTSSLGLRRAVEMIRGEDGTEVVLKVKRKGEAHPFDVVIGRGRVVYER